MGQEPGVCIWTDVKTQTHIVYDELESDKYVTKMTFIWGWCKSRVAKKKKLTLNLEFSVLK